MEKNQGFWSLVACVSLLLVNGSLFHPVHAGSNSVPIIGVVPLIAFNISVSAIHTTDVTVTWNTNEEANSTVEYGPTTGYGSLRTDSALVTNHTITLDGLSPRTVYHYRIQSADSFGNRYESADLEFTTTGNPPGPGGGGTGGGAMVTPTVGVEVFYNGVSTPVTGVGTLTSGTIISSLSGIPHLRSSWSVNITVEPPAGARFITYTLSRPSDLTKSAFDATLASQGLQMTALAYMVVVKKSQPIATGTATIQMTIKRSWVSDNGGVGAVRIIREGDDGLVQILETTFSNYDIDTGYMNFRAISYDGLSVFALIAVKSAPGTVPTSPVLTSVATTVVPPGIVSGAPAPTMVQMMAVILAIVMMIILGLILEMRVGKK